MFGAHHEDGWFANVAIIAGKYAMTKVVLGINVRPRSMGFTAQKRGEALSVDVLGQWELAKVRKRGVKVDVFNEV